MPLQAGDQTFETVWPGNTTPQAVDGTGTAPRSLCGFVLQNTAASARYVRLFNASGAPTMGTTKAKLVIPLAAGAVLTLNLLRPPLFDLGLWVAVTAGQSDTDNAAPTSGDVLVNVLYQ